MTTAEQLKILGGKLGELFKDYIPAQGNKFFESEDMNIYINAFITALHEGGEDDDPFFPMHLYYLFEAPAMKLKQALTDQGFEVALHMEEMN